MDGSLKESNVVTEISNDLADSGIEETIVSVPFDEFDDLMLGWQHHYVDCFF